MALSFTPDPRATLARLRQRELVGRSLTPIQPRANPYAKSPWADAAQQLAYAVSGKWAGEDARRIEAEQRAAQYGLANILRDAEGYSSGGPYYEQTPVTQRPVGAGAPLMGTEYKRRDMPDLRDDGSMPTPEMLETAGAVPGEFAGELAAARDRASDRWEAGRLAQANDQLALARQDGNLGMMEYWASEIDAVGSADRVFDATAEERARLLKDVLVYTLDGRKVTISRAAFEEDQKQSEPIYTRTEPLKDIDPDLNNFEVVTPFVWKGRPRKVGDQFVVDLRDPDFKQFLDYGILTSKTVTSYEGPDEDVGDRVEDVFGTGTLDDLSKIHTDDRLNLGAASTGDIGGWIARGTSAVAGVFGEDPVYGFAERTQKEAEKLRLLGLSIMASVARTISPRVAVWTQKLVGESMPDPDSSNSSNVAKIRALIPKLQERYREIAGVLRLKGKNALRGLKRSEARTALEELRYYLPILAQSVSAYEQGVIDWADQPLGTRMWDNKGNLREKVSMEGGDGKGEWKIVE